jgi:hypothetical protein
MFVSPKVVVTRRFDTEGRSTRVQPDTLQRCGQPHRKPSSWLCAIGKPFLPEPLARIGSCLAPLA